MKIRLTPAQISALECAGLESPDDAEQEALAAAWRGRTLVVTEETRDALFSAINDRSNAEDAAAQQGGEMAVYAARAARSLAALASRVLRAKEAR